MGFPRKEYWSGLPFPSPGDLPNPGVEPVSPALQADALPSEPPGKPSILLWWYEYTTFSLFIHLLMDVWLFLLFDYCKYTAKTFVYISF